MYQHQPSSSGLQEVSTKRLVRDGAWRVSSGRYCRWVCRSGVAPLWLLLTTLLLPGAWSYLNEEQEELLVELHNHYRGLVTPSASAMLPLQWDTSLKVIAEGYAAKCMWNHNPDLEDTGENLFAGTKALDLRQALEEWFLEHLDYNFNNNSCDEDKMCGHYTQMVWAETHRVGCALHLCSTLQGLNWDRASFLVCNYYPAGNYEGERPYVEGDWCSRCPENMQKCENNLCVAEDEEADEDDEEGETATWGPIAPSQESTSTFFNLGEQIEDRDEELFVLPAVTAEPQPDVITTITTTNNNPVGNLLDSPPPGTPEPGTPEPPSHPPTVHITTGEKPVLEPVEEKKEGRKEEDERKEIEREPIRKVNHKIKEITRTTTSAAPPLYVPLVPMTVMLANICHIFFLTLV